MTTTVVTTTAATRLILALDLGKYKSVACLDRSAEDHRFHSLVTDREAIRRLLTQHQPAVVLLEACLVAGWADDLCVERGVPCLVANTGSEAWKFKHLKRKTDRDDALRLAELYALGNFPRVSIPAKESREKRVLIELRQKLVGRRVAVQNRLRAILVSQGLLAPRGAAAWSAAGLADFTQHAQPLADGTPAELGRGRLQRALIERHRSAAGAASESCELLGPGEAVPVCCSAWFGPVTTGRGANRTSSRPLATPTLCRAATIARMS